MITGHLMEGYNEEYVPSADHKSDLKIVGSML